MDSTPTRVKRSADAVWRVIDGEVVILFPQESALHALTGCGSRIWQLLEEETTVPDVVSSICEEYDVERERAAEEVSAYIDRLESMNLIDVIPVEEKEPIR